VSIRVVVADDQDLVRLGVAGLLDAEDGIEVVGTAKDGEDAVRLVRELRPDVVVMDIRMPVLDGIDATERICHDPDLVGTRVLVLTTFDLDEYVYAALRAGASGFLLKDSRSETLIDAVHVIADGEALLSPAATRRLIARFGAAPGSAAVPPQFKSLTSREREILQMVAKGLSNEEITQQLTISHATVKTHVSHVMTKLGARDRAQLVTWAFEWGVVTPGM
jgi:DNA-binding NarL/FixJ family response regulator